MVGWSVGRRGVRWRRALSDGGRRMDGSFYFFLELPAFHHLNNKKLIIKIYNFHEIEQDLCYMQELA